MKLVQVVITRLRRIDISGMMPMKSTVIFRKIKLMKSEAR